MKNQFSKNTKTYVAFLMLLMLQGVFFEIQAQSPTFLTSMAERVSSFTDVLTTKVARSIFGLLVGICLTLGFTGFMRWSRVATIAGSALGISFLAEITEFFFG